MKTSILWNQRLIQALPLTPEQTTKMLENHFGLPWSHLKANGFTLNPPSRGERAQQDIIADSTEPNGSVWGVRFFDIMPPGFLVSPTSRWIWESSTGVVPEFSNSEAVRNHHGFHAAWVADLRNWSGSSVDHPEKECKALVRGFGDVVLGTEGWRSSKMKVEKALLTSGGQLNALRIRYPEVAFDVGTWSCRPELLYYLEFPRNLKKLAGWLRDKSLNSLKDEF